MRRVALHELTAADFADEFAILRRDFVTNYSNCLRSASRIGFKTDGGILPMDLRIKA
jgi:hypothetical protein